ncbi:hypothetical protein [Halosegnis longus]|uniref:hypothetical protein n=1 Tax=Halosegnis longus TaxID=2216012 RepID=UPI00129DADBD|nr:hypothetical protein [Halosegnis longus]
MSTTEYQNESETVYVSKGRGNNYHGTPACSDIAPKAMTLEDAQEDDYEPCPMCNTPEQ